MKPGATPEIANPGNLCHLPHPVSFVGSCLGGIAPETARHIRRLLRVRQPRHWECPPRGASR